MSEAALWRPLEWDTAFFGVKTARILAARPTPERWAEALAGCAGWGAQVVHYLAESDDDAASRLAEGAGFHLMDIRVTLEWRVADLPAAPAAAVRDYREDDLPVLLPIARTSYTQSRYYHDPRYPRERCGALYDTWLAQDCTNPTGLALVAEHDGQPAGFVTCSYDAKARRGRISLVGIAAEAYGQGIGRQLVQAAQRWFAGQGAATAEVVTQGRNVVAQRLYQSSGFRTSQVQLWYHGWTEDGVYEPFVPPA